MNKMPHSLEFKSQFLFSKHFLLLNPVVETNALLRDTNFATKFQSFHSSLRFSRQIHKLRPITYARKSRRRSGFQRSRKFMLQLISILASNLHILPQPLDFVIEELNGGDGGGLGFLKGFGGGGFGWRRRKTGNFGFLVILGLLGFWFLLFGRDLKTNVFCGFLGLGSFGIVLIRGFKRNVKDLIFGLCCFGGLICLGWKRAETMKWVEESRSCSPMAAILGTGKRKGRRAFFNGGR